MSGVFVLPVNPASIFVRGLAVEKLDTGLRRYDVWEFPRCQYLTYFFRFVRQ